MRGGADSADVVKSRADVGRLGLGMIMAGMPSVEAPQTTGGEAVDGEDGFGGAGGGDIGAAIITDGSRADVDRPGFRLRDEERSMADLWARHEQAKMGL